MRAPILPYYGDQLLFGIKPPTPIIRPIAGWGAYNTAQDMYIPSVAGDGSYFTLGLVNLKYYNKSNTLIWTLAATTLNFGGIATNLLGFCYAGGQYVLVAYLSGTIRAFTLSNPYVNNNTNLLSGIVALSINPTLTLGQTTLMPSGVNFKLRYTSNTVFTGINDVVFSTSAKISEGLVAQNTMTLTWDTLPTLYETTDATIQCGITSYDVGRPFHANIWRGGKHVKVPITWAAPRRNVATTLYPCIMDTSVQFSPVADGLHMGYHGVDRVDFDRWLVDICNAMGI